MPVKNSSDEESWTVADSHQATQSATMPPPDIRTSSLKQPIDVAE